MTDRLELPRHYREQLEVLLRAHVPGVEVWAYGSRVNGESHEGSDLDLVLRGPALEPLDGGLYDLLEAIGKSNIPILIQAHDWAMLPESFHREIERDYVVVQEEVGKQTTSGEWRTALWGELATLEYGKSLRDYASTVGVYKVYGTNGQIGWHSEPLCPYPSIIIGRKGAYRGVHYSPDPFFVIDTAFYLNPKVEMDTRWAYYALLTQDIDSMDSGSAIPSTSREDFYGLPVLVPPLPTQRAIAHILGTLDDKIELNRRMNETLEAMARALFKSWFVDFDPVRAKMEGRWRDGESLPGLPAEYYDLFPDRLVDSELGEVPEGWEVKALEEVVEFHDSRRVPLNSRQRANRQGPYPYYGATGIMDYVEDFLFDGVYVLTGEDGSVIDASGHPVVQYVWGQFWANNHAHVLRGKNGVSEEHLNLLLQYQNIVPFVTGAVQPKLSQHNLKAIPIVLPTISTCEAFSDLLQPMFAAIRSHTAEALTLAAQRDALLPKLVSGEVRVGKVV